MRVVVGGCDTESPVRILENATAVKGIESGRRV